MSVNGVALAGKDMAFVLTVLKEATLPRMLKFVRVTQLRRPPPPTPGPPGSSDGASVASSTGSLQQGGNSSMAPAGKPQGTRTRPGPIFSHSLCGPRTGVG